MQLSAVLEQRSDGVRVVFENPSNPNNVWAALRTCDAFGVHSVNLILALYIVYWPHYSVCTCLDRFGWLARGATASLAQGPNERGSGELMLLTLLAPRRPLPHSIICVL